MDTQKTQQLRHRAIADATNVRSLPKESHFKRARARWKSSLVFPKKVECCLTCMAQSVVETRRCLVRLRSFADLEGGVLIQIQIFDTTRRLFRCKRRIITSSHLSIDKAHDFHQELLLVFVRNNGVSDSEKREPFHGRVKVFNSISLIPTDKIFLALVNILTSPSNNPKMLHTIELDPA